MSGERNRNILHRADKKPCIATDIINLSNRIAANRLRSAGASVSVPKLTLSTPLKSGVDTSIIKSKLFYSTLEDNSSMDWLSVVSHACSFTEIPDISNVDPGLNLLLTTLLITNQFAFPQYLTEDVRKTFKNSYHELVEVSLADLIHLYTKIPQFELNPVYADLIQKGNDEVLRRLLIGNVALLFCMMDKHLTPQHYCNWIDRRLSSFTSSLGIALDLIKRIPHPSIKFIENMNVAYSYSDALKRNTTLLINQMSQGHSPSSKIFKIVGDILRRKDSTSNFFYQKKK